MKINGREVIVKADFADMLDEIAAWFIANDRIQAAQDFVQGVYDAMVTKIAPSPEKYGEYPWKRTPTKAYRRFPFRKKWYIIYKVSPSTIAFLAIVYSKRDLSKLDFE